MSDDTELKREFARHYARLGNADAAARLVFPDDPAKSLLVGMAWASDETVLAFKADIEADAPLEELIPTKEDLLLELWRIGTGERPTDTKDRLTALDQFAKVAGYIQKPEAGNVNVNVGFTNKVMVVPAEQTLEEWEAETKRQQAELIAQAQKSNTSNARH